MNRILIIGVNLLLFWASSALGQSVPFKLHQGYLIVAKCSVAGLPDLTAVIDTGATETAIDLRLANRLGLPMRPDSADFFTGEGVVQAVSIPNVRLGPVQAESLSGIAVDLAGMERYFGMRPDLLIGMDLLHRTDFTIDYRSQQLIFGTVPNLVHSAQLVLESRFALVEAIVEGKPVRLQIDTGLNGFLLFGDRAPVRTGFPQMGARAVSIGQSLRVQSADVALELGDWHTRSMTASVIERRSAPTVFDGLLGGRPFAHRKLAFDFERLIVSWE